MTCGGIAMEDRPKNTSWTTQTIDLGDDLVDHTRIVGHGELPEDELIAADEGDPALRLPPPGPLDPEQITDLLQSAKILISEGFLDDAKKILRRIVISDPGHLVARKRLEEIHEAELKQIFSQADSPGPRDDQSRSAPARVDGEVLMRELDRELGLGVFADGTAGESQALERLVFGDAQAMEQFAAHLERDQESASARDRLDLGVAFFEMELFHLAARQFQSAAGDPGLNASAVTLLASALIQSGRAFEAGLALEPLLGDPEVPREEKIEPMYLMARANESLRRPEEALKWYRLVHEVAAGYRDCEDRVRMILDQKYGTPEKS